MANTEYIKRQAALNIVCSDDCVDCPDGGCDKYRWIKRLPAEDVRPVVRGEWVSVHDGYGICSNCHRGDHIDPLAGFCRFCGADMRKKGGRDGA